MCDNATSGEKGVVVQARRGDDLVDMVSRAVDSLSADYIRIMIECRQDRLQTR
jgi:hypothetical protein